jgi:xanthine/CO dehydrogenase XdhC/CoxF family maturation factor
MEIAAFGISVVSLVVAVVALVQARRVRTQSAEREISASAAADPGSDGEGSVAPAEIVVNLERMGHASELVVENTGDESAREVVVTFDPPSSAGGPTLHEPPFPVAVAAHHVVRVPAVITFSTPPNVHTIVRWSDAAGDHERVVILPTA